MKTLKRICFFILVSVLVVTVLSGCASKKKSEGQLDVKISFGYEDAIKIMAQNPLIANIVNNGPAFSGELQIQIEDNMSGKVIMAMPFEIAENAQKEIQIEVPVFIIQKKFNVAIVSEKKKLYEETIKSTNVLSPNQHVMAVVTDTPDAYRFLENTKTVSQNQNADYAMKYGAMPDVYAATETEELKVFYFDSFEQINTLEKLGYFDYIYMGHSQSLTISKEVEDALSKWIEQGNCFVIETGADYEKMNSILPSSLNPIKVDGVEKVQIGTIWQDIQLDQEIDIATGGNLDTSMYVFQQEEAAIGAVTKVGEGSILTLMVNMGLEPLASWNSKAPFITTILEGALTSDTIMYSDGNGYYNGGYGGSPYQYMLQQVPVEKQTPYMMILIIFIIYILLVAPISYLILKKLDKRDFAWIGIPIMAILCIGTLYIFGGNTRYTKAITNSISILTADTKDDFMTIKSEMNIFNNAKDALKVEWDPSENIKFNYSQPDMYYTGPYVDPTVTDKKVTGKITFGNPQKYEKYNAPLWSSTYLTGEKVIPFEANSNMVLMELNGTQVKITVKNTTPYMLQNAFIQWGQGFIFIGDLQPGDEKQAVKELNAMLPVPFEKFLSTEMGITPFDYANKPNQKDLEDQRLYEFLMQRYVYWNQYNSQKTDNAASFNTVKLCAMNNQAIGYELKVNGDDTQDFATNIMEISTVVNFESGTKIKIPEGIISPETSYSLDEQLATSGNFEFQPFDQTLRFYEQGIAQFYFTLPEVIDITNAHVELGDVYAEQDYYNMQNGVPATPIQGIIYSVYNVKADAWEEIGKSFDFDAKFIDETGRITFTVNFKVGETENKDPKMYNYVHMMKLPLISVEGSVK